MPPGAIFAHNDNESTTLETPRKFQQLIDDVEELLARLDDEHSPQLDQLRNRIEATLTTFNERGRSTAAQVRHYAGMADALHHRISQNRFRIRHFDRRPARFLARHRALERLRTFVRCADLAADVERRSP